MSAYELALAAEASGEPARAAVIPATATKAEIAAQLATTRAKLMALDKGDPAYASALAAYQELLTRDASGGDATAEVATPTPDEDRAVAAATTDVYTLPAGMTWDTEVVADLFGRARTTFGNAGEGVLGGGIHIAAAALREIAATGPPDPVQTEAALRSRWGSAYDHEISAASEAWDTLPKAVQKSLTETGVRYSAAFVTYAAEVGKKMFKLPGGAERMLARLHDEDEA